jgi:hypothetical protein
VSAALDAVGIKKSPGCKCPWRQAWLNWALPIPRPLAAWIKQPTLLARFEHGFGDAVQFTTVLLHLRHLHPEWAIDVSSKVGAHTLFRGLARHVYSEDKSAEGYTDYRWVPWHEPWETYSNSPSTKAEQYLRHAFQIEPIEELCRYAVCISDEVMESASDYLAEMCGRRVASGQRYPIVLIHYQGNSAKDAKDMSERVARELCLVAKRAGFLPFVLEWETKPRSRLSERDGIAINDVKHPFWGGTGTGDGEKIAAMIQQSAYMIGIDSGPEHVAGATDTPTMIAWHQFHPVNYYGLADNVEHVIRPGHRRFIFGDHDTGDEYFRRKYRFAEADKHYRYFLPALLKERLAAL